MSRGPLGCCFALALAAVPAGAQAPLDLGDLTPRAVAVQFEDSADLSVVGQSFGPSWPASYSVSGGQGRVEIDAQTHALIRQLLSLPPVPGSFTPIVIEIDLVSGVATSLPAAGAYDDGTISFAFSTAALDTEATGGFVGPDVSPLFCTSQQQIDDACPFVPILCGQVCTLVPGSRFEPSTGRANLIGSEEQLGCDGAACFGPSVLFAGQGDLRILELPPSVPAAGVGLRILLAGLLVFTARRGLATRRVALDATSRSGTLLA